MPTNFYVFKGIMKIKLIRIFGRQIIKSLWLKEIAHDSVEIPARWSL